MNLSTYQTAIKRTVVDTGHADLLKLALLGLLGELGEVADPIKKHLWAGHPLDVAHLQEEIGDVCWYLALLCNELGIALSDAFQDNLDKLQRRYPEGFSPERSQHRCLESEARR